MADLTQKSKYLSLILRHDPSKGRVSLDKNGWCDVRDLIDNAGFTMDELRQIVSTDNKGRYEFSEHENHIRARQGHSIKVDIDSIERADPPAILYHGTTEKNLDSILDDGLKKMNRNHVHLSADVKTAQTVGGRGKGKVVILEIDSMWMRALDIKFYRSGNGVWLTDYVDPKFITVLK